MYHPYCQTGKVEKHCICWKPSAAGCWIHKVLCTHPLLWQWGSRMGHKNLTPALNTCHLFFTALFTVFSCWLCQCIIITIELSSFSPAIASQTLDLIAEGFCLAGQSQSIIQSSVGEGGEGCKANKAATSIEGEFEHIVFWQGNTFLQAVVLSFWYCCRTMSQATNWLFKIAETCQISYGWSLTSSSWHHHNQSSHPYWAVGQAWVTGYRVQSYQQQHAHLLMMGCSPHVWHQCPVHFFKSMSSQHVQVLKEKKAHEETHAFTSASNGNGDSSDIEVSEIMGNCGLMKHACNEQESHFPIAQCSHPQRNPANIPYFLHCLLLSTVHSFPWSSTLPSFSSSTSMWKKDLP